MNFFAYDERQKRYGYRKKIYNSDDIVCVRCSKACNGKLCEWVEHLTIEHIPEGADYYISSTGNVHITHCPQFDFGRNGDKHERI